MYDKKLKAKLFLNLLKIRLFAKKKRKKKKQNQKAFCLYLNDH